MKVINVNNYPNTKVVTAKVINNKLIIAERSNQYHSCSVYQTVNLGSGDFNRGLLMKRKAAGPGLVLRRLTNTRPGRGESEKYWLMLAYPEAGSLISSLLGM